MMFEAAWYTEAQKTGDPKYVRLYRCIRKEIETGNIAAGSMIPSIRQVSKGLGISSTTVENAYNQLMVEGYIYSIPQKGYYAAKLDPAYFNLNQPVKESNEIRNHTSINTDFMDVNIFKFQEWRKVYTQVLDDYQHRILVEGDPQGEYELRKTLSDYVVQARGVKCNPEQVIIGAGVQTLLRIFCDIATGILSPKFAFEEPGFTDVRPVFMRSGYSLHAIPLNENGIQIKSLYDSQASVCYISPSHQYPTGLVMPVQSRLELLKWAEQTKGFILEDDYDSELRFEGRPVPSLFSLDNGGRVINIGSFSTLLAPSIRISYMVLPKSLQKLYRRISQEYRSTVSTAEQLTLALYMKEGYFGKHLRRMRKKCSEKQKVLISEAEKYASYINLHETDTGTFVFMEALSDAIAESIRNNAKQMGFRIRESWERFFVLNYAVIP